MLLLNFLLLPVALSMGRHVETQNYALTIEDNTLKDIRIIGKTPDELNLSNLCLKAIENNTFSHLKNLKSLNLSNNALLRLPELALANLENLENLDLANNHLLSGKFYLGLSGLKTLNISNNLVDSYEEGHFFGLTNATNIYTKGIKFSKISAGIFENPPPVKNRLPKEFKVDGYTYSISFADEIEQAEKYNKQFNQNGNAEAKVCIVDGHLKSVEAFKKDEVLPEGCNKVSYDNNILRLGSSDIRTFEKGWFRLQDKRVNTIDLGLTPIKEFTKELLNDLPAWIRKVSLEFTRIEKLKRGIIKNDHIVALDLGWNHISEIEEGALENLNELKWLSLNHNRLTDTKFLDSLPSKIFTVGLDVNKITEISTGNFSKFANFENLSLRVNNITEIKSRRLGNFSSLKALIMDHCSLNNIESDAFRDLKNLAHLELSDNQITDLKKGTFVGLDNIERIDLDNNKLKEIPNDVFNPMPNSFRSLSINNNEIEILKSGTFANSPRINSLFLGSNKISKIEKGAFNLPSLERLSLQDNLLRNVEGDMFQGLDNMAELSLAQNGITTIKKGLTKKMGELYDLYLGYNPIKILENGAFFGLTKTETNIHLDGVNVEIIQGGLFDDV